MRFCIKCGHVMEHDYLNVGWICPYCGYKEWIMFEKEAEGD